MVIDRTRARHRLGRFLLRHGRPERWLLQQHFEEPALAATYAHYRAVLAGRDAQLEAIGADLAGWYDRAPFADAVGRLAAYRGITRLGALTLASEVCDWRRFPPAAAFAGSAAWCPGSTPAAAPPGGPHHQVWQRPPGCPAGRVGWAYQHRPAVGLELHDRQQAWTPGSRPRLGRPVAAVRALPAAGRPQGLQEPGRHRDRPGAHRVPVGRDGGLTGARPSVTAWIGATVTASRTPHRGTAAAGPIPPVLCDGHPGARVVRAPSCK
jgi:hypothetical protein